MFFSFTVFSQCFSVMALEVLLTTLPSTTSSTTVTTFLVVLELEVLLLYTHTEYIMHFTLTAHFNLVS